MYLHNTSLWGISVITSYSHSHNIDIVVESVLITTDAFRHVSYSVDSVALERAHHAQMHRQFVLAAQVVCACVVFFVPCAMIVLCE